MKKLTLAILLPLLASCSVNHGDFTVLSNKLVDTKNFHLDKSSVQKNVTGKDVGHIIVFVPTKMNVTPSEAMNDVFRNTDADVLTDVTLKSWGWYIPYIYGEMGWSVEGDAVKTRSK